MNKTDYAELMAFLAVAEENNFRRAAQRLGLSPSAVSHSIRALESRLRVRLFNRTTRSVSPTEAGRVFMAQLIPAVAALESAVLNVGETQLTPRGSLRINMPRLAGRRVMLPALERFMNRFVDIRLELVIDDNLDDVVAAGFDAGIRAGDRVPKDMIAVRLTPDLAMIIVASPRCFADRPPPLSVDELAQHRCINYRWDGSGAQYRWLLSGEGKTVEVTLAPALTVNDIDILLTAAEEGAGLALLEEQSVAAALKAGRLVRVLPEWRKPVSGFHLYYPRNAFMTPAMRAFVDFMRQEARADSCCGQ
ncbi:LysR family transcriptional regulator (plasmid) [Sodalis praecaptivus]|uniref:LysR family transcriptional regulator n=2 Tax=Sodalis praecaptivus TaxID=1239307 RepID=W0HZF0_9GAMM|nr:LysR family transcriptional regulator [Sodalis praecaptivus]AHF79216.1 LysR family transcriptional regulator [Sodalis praecaptivus]